MYIRHLSQAVSRRKVLGGIKVRVAVHHAHPVVLRVLESGDHAEDSLLLAELEACLEADEVVHRFRPVVLPELQACIGLLACPGVDKTYGLERAVPHGILASRCHRLYRHAPFEDDLLIEILYLSPLRRNQGVSEGNVFFLVHRAVDVIVSALAVS